MQHGRNEGIKLRKEKSLSIKFQFGNRQQRKLKLKMKMEQKKKRQMEDISLRLPHSSHKSRWKGLKNETDI